MIGKRLFDMVTAAIVFVLTLPVTFVVALLIWFNMGRPILFRQVRAGRNGKPFVLVKFRTMKEAVGADGTPLPDHQRTPRLGRILRALTLDELPALWNVIKGDMSLVGPRPLFTRYIPRYTERQRTRLAVKPGLTGWAVVHGRNLLDWEERLELDAWYVENASWRTDLKILFRTIGLVLRRRGVNHSGDVTMHEFTGTKGENHER